MIHMTEELLIEAYHGDVDDASRQHLQQCEECRAELERLSGLLDSVRDYPVPERDELYGSDVWARLVPSLPVEKPRASWFRWWMLTPALATLVLVAFFAGMFTGQRQTGISEKARERILLMALSDHLDRSQILLTELLHADPETAALSGERDRARELLGENRLLRQSALHMGDARDADLLDALERVLLDVANGGFASSSNGLQMIQQRIDNEALLFKVRITGTDARRRGQNL
jgi:hypothetical protein